MYGKLFAQMYDGTLGTCGPWEALVTFQQLVILADADGVVDMTPEVIARRTTIPLEIVTKGLAALERPDPDSRTPDEDGRRIVRLSDTRAWGWRIVNYEKYRNIRSAEERRVYHRNYWHKRKTQQTQHSQPPQPKQTKVDVEVEVDVKKKDTVGLAPDILSFRKQAIEILGFLNEKTERNYQPVLANVDIIVARLKDGATLADLRAVVAKKAREWKGDAKMDLYIRPATLFNRTKFAQYQGELGKAES